jgi:hypothetical protein
MNRSTLRGVALAVLALLGTPVAMHVVLHDLHDHHQAPPRTAFAEDDCHGDHEHPVVGSPAPTMLARSAMTVAVISPVPTLTLVRHSSADRNRVSPGALRLDDDVGLHTLLSTFLI